MTGRVLLLGATGTIGRATARALLDAGFEVVALVRQGAVSLPGCQVVQGRVTDPSDVAAVMADARPSAVVSCLASRTGEPADAWAVDHAAHSAVLKAAVAVGVGQFVLLSAICVQKPKLEFQRAKLAFEAELMAAPIDWSIVRATAYFKSLSGQVARVQAGKPFLVFGDGRLTACKPISDADLGRYLALCLTEPAMRNRVSPVGGPGPAVTPLDQVAMLERLTGKLVTVKRVPVAMMDAIIAGLAAGGILSAKLRAKAELARIGRYYATESMLVWDGARYDAEATPEFGTDRLEDHYAAMLRGEVADDRGAHKVF
ncbi:NAD-dependent epimerase/dehydratase family protein [Tabrizicola piscis]|uniref:Divinyl chlorophyllide a 8-vinyl-reductase, chloroplastic n=1 Tax=Tabrizicola piscis TaxID=2494374 RepID=A0A3S8U5Z7_9RHOB|nr:NAD(P)H-binding protein [Tabrizicola piscis]AZL59031.1 NAD-dependent epimerase/dehydratase family protein [Tabrizicola piscis]